MLSLSYCFKVCHLYYFRPKPLIEHLQRGMPLTSTDRDYIIPQLAVFCSLFGTTLMAVHDAEFYKDIQEKVINLSFDVFSSSSALLCLSIKISRDFYVLMGFLAEGNSCAV